MNVYGDRIKQIIQKRGITLKELSKIIDVPYTTLYYNVNNDTMPKMEIIEKIADAMGISKYEIISGDSSNQNYFLDKIQESLNSIHELIDDNILNDIIKDYKKLNDDGKVYAASLVHSVTKIQSLIINEGTDDENTDSN